MNLHEVSVDGRQVMVVESLNLLRVTWEPISALQRGPAVPIQALAGEERKDSVSPEHETATSQ